MWNILATAGDDKVVKLWLIHEGQGTYEYHGQTQ